MAEPTPVLAETLRQIKALETSERPLVVCDVDEVALHFIAHLEEHLQGLGLVFLSHDYKLTGNIADRNGAPLPADAVRSLLQAFFDDWTHRQQPVQGAPQALSRLSQDADIVFLTNLPGAWNRDTRARTLSQHGMHYPVITNTGPKGGAVAALAAGRPGPVVFIDDSPQNIRSVQTALADCILIHFVADKRFFATSETIAGVDLKTDDWTAVEAYISTCLSA
jgi:beta-phosphoglucomutase-like phosphatase (HAD superfamily)